MSTINDEFAALHNCASAHCDHYSPDQSRPTEHAEQIQVTTEYSCHTIHELLAAGFEPSDVDFRAKAFQSCPVCTAEPTWVQGRGLVPVMYVLPSAEAWMYEHTSAPQAGEQEL